MAPKKIILLVISIVAAIALALWGFFIIRDRYSNNDVIPRNSSNENKPSTENSNVNSPDFPQTSPPEVPDDSATPSAPEVAPFVKIEREDCLNSCKRFTIQSELAYCQQSCGLTAVQDNPSDCSDKSGLDKDYCFKDLAIKDMDFKVCEKISDKGIKTTCINRLTEDILDQQLKNLPKIPE